MYGTSIPPRWFELALAKTAAQPEVEAVLVAALGALPHVSPAFQEAPHCGIHGKNWNVTPADERIEGTFQCIF